MLLILLVVVLAMSIETINPINEGDKLGAEITGAIDGFNVGEDVMNISQN